MKLSAIASSVITPITSMALSGSSFPAGSLFENNVEHETVKLSEKYRFTENGPAETVEHHSFYFYKY